MGIKEQLLGKKPEKELPDEFEPTEEAQKVIDGTEEDEIKDFIRNKKARQAGKEALKTKKEEPEPEKQPVQAQPEQPVEQPQQPVQEPQTDKRVSNFAKILTLYVTPVSLESDKEALHSAVEGGYMVGMQAGIQITNDNVDKVKSVLKYLTDNGYLVVISGEQVEPVSDAAGK